MPTPRIHRLFVPLLALFVLPACTTVQTMQTTYFRNSYQEITKAGDPVLLPHAGQPAFSAAADMTARSRTMHAEGFTLLGYSQFVSPLLTGLADGYATKWGAEVGATQVVMETPRPGPSNLHYFLVTYWGRYNPEGFALGAVWQDLPAELLQQIGADKNLVIVLQVIPGTPAAAAGLRADDVVATIDGEYVQNTTKLTQKINASPGQEVVLGISREGEALDLPVRLGTPKPRSGPSTAGYRDSPWLTTEIKDWSALSLANLAITNMAATVQRIEHDRQLFNERLRAQAQRNQADLAAQPAETGVTDRRGGGKTRAELRPAGGPYSRLSPAEQMMIWKKTEEWGRMFSAQMDRQRQQAVLLFLQNAPNVYRVW